MSVQSSFAALSKKARRQSQVSAGLARNAPNLRAVVQRQLERFGGDDATPASIADEAIAFALWGEALQPLFLDYHQAVGGLARVLEVVIAASFYEHRAFEWDSREWGLRRAPASAALGSQGLDLWAELRRRAKKVKASELTAALKVVDGAVARALLLRGALAYVFPKHKGLWSAQDDVAIRHFDVEDYAGRRIAVLPCLRDTALEPKKGELPDAALLRKTLKEKSVSALRLTCEWEELQKLGTLEAREVLAEFADWGHLPDLEPKQALELAPMLSTRRPRRVHGLRFVRGVLHRATLRDPKLAQKSRDAVVAECLKESGALLPAAPWTSPWAVAAKKPQGKPVPPANAPTLSYREALHWTDAEREAGRPEEDVTVASSKAVRKELDREKRAGTRFLFQLSRMTDADALAVWLKVPPAEWYGHVVDVQHPLVRFGLKVLEPALAYVALKPDRLPALAGVESPRVARLMARGFVKVKKMKDVGDAWLRRFPRAAAQGLLPELIHAEKERRDVAAVALEHLRAQAPTVVDAVAAELGPEWAAFVSASLAQTKKLPRKPSLPAFVDLSTLPRPITVTGEALRGEGLEELVCLIKLGLGPEARFDPASLSRTAWELFSRWLAAGAPPKEKWCMQALALFPTDDTAAALGPLARHWAPSGSPTRAQDAVEVLAAMRTPAGLAQVMMLSKVQSKALRAKAATVLEQQATQLGLTTEDLADRLVPDFGALTVTTDDGELTVRFDAKLKPSLVDERGAPATLPKNADESAREWWLALECGAPPVGRATARRLERAMVEGRAMTLEHFTETYALHSVLSQLARGVLWGEYEQGRLLRALAFDGGALLDVNGQKVAPTKELGVVHPADLDDAALAKWRARLTEQPFVQLLRPFKRVTAKEVETQVAALEGRELDTERLIKLARAGWKQGESHQGGCYNSLERGGVVLGFTPGIYLGDWKLNARQTLEGSVSSPEPRASLRSEVTMELSALVT